MDLNGWLDAREDKPEKDGRYPCICRNKDNGDYLREPIICVYDKSCDDWWGHFLNEDGRIGVFWTKECDAEVVYWYPITRIPEEALGGKQ